MATRGAAKAKRSVATTATSAPAPGGNAEVRLRRVLRLVVIGYLFVAGLYVTTIPRGGGPDETAHVRYVQWLAESHSLPVFDRQNPGSNYEFHQPPLYYLVSLPAYLIASSPAEKDQALRFVNAIIGIALLYLTFAFGRTIAPERPWVAVAAAAVVAFLPMHLALVSSAGNDVLTEVFVAAAILIIVRYLRSAAQYRSQPDDRAPGVSASLLAGLMIGLGLLTKSIAVLLFPTVWLGLAFAARGPNGYEWRRLARDLAAATAVALAIAGWWLVRNQALYGDLLAQKAFLVAFRDRPSPQVMMSKYHLLPAQYVIMTIGWTIASAVGVFGERFAFFPYQVYLGFAAKALAEAISFTRFLLRQRLADWQLQSWLMSALLAALLLASFVRFNLSFFQAQARYLFPALPPAAVALCVGIEGLAPKGKGGIALIIGVALVLALATVGFFSWIVPQFETVRPAILGAQR